MAVAVPANLTNIVDMVGGDYYTLALKADGTLVEWGVVASGVDYIPAGAAVTNIPVIIPPGLTNIVAISHGLALIGDAPPVLGMLQASITNIFRDATGFHCSIPTESGRVYRLEYKESLDQTNWNSLPLTAGNGGDLTLTDSVACGIQRFYRVRRW